MEAFFFSRNRLQNKIALLWQVGVMASHLVNDDISHLRQKGARKSEQRAKASCSAQDHTQDIAAPFVAGEDAIGYQEGDRTAMVGNGAIARQIGVAMLIIFFQELLDALHDRRKSIGIV